MQTAIIEKLKVSPLRLPLAFFLAPPIGSLLATVITLISTGAIWDLDQHLGRGTSISPFLVILTAPYLGMVFGIIVHVIFNKIGWFKWWHYVLAGVICPYVTILIVVTLAGGFIPLMNATTPYQIYRISILSLWGACCALIFWLLAIYKNPRYQK